MGNTGSHENVSDPFPSIPGNSSLMTCSSLRSLSLSLTRNSHSGIYPASSSGALIAGACAVGGKNFYFF
jgi:hypothetical protein